MGGFQRVSVCCQAELLDNRPIKPFSPLGSAGTDQHHTGHAAGRRVSLAEGVHGGRPSEPGHGADFTHGRASITVLMDGFGILERGISV